MRALNNLLTCDARGKSGGGFGARESGLGIRKFKIPDLRFKNKWGKNGDCGFEIQEQAGKTGIRGWGLGGWGSEIEDSRFKIQKQARTRYSSTKMFFLAQMSFRIFGQTVTLTSPRCALRSNNIRVRDWPMPPPIDRGIWLVKIPW